MAHTMPETLVDDAAQAAAMLRLPAELTIYTAAETRASWLAWLAGDAAHNIHPLAGLGLNLGLADVAELANVLQAREAKDYWRNVGDRYFMRRYERARKAGMVPTWLACDGLQRLFAHSNTGVQALRNWGMNGFNSLASVKAWAMQQAMG